MKRAVVFVWCVLLLGLIAVTGARRGRRPRFCYLPAATGDCKSCVWSWYYNSELNSCEPFIYGGCGGNKNRFRTVLACQKDCRSTCVGLSMCDVKCRSGFQKSEDGCPVCKCMDPCENVKCGSREVCESIGKTPDMIGVCIDMCDLPKKMGHCFGRMPRWFFNKGSCERFIFGGCGGNRNNFMTREECRRTCLGPRFCPEKDCLFGHVYDKSGNPTCECLANECTYSKECAVKGKACIPQKICMPCKGDGCPPRFICVKDKPGQCPRYRNGPFGRYCTGADTECPGTKRCCNVGPGSFVCLNPM